MDGWSVEVRYAYHDPVEIAGVLLDNRWRPLIPIPSPVGVPRGPRYWAAIHEMTNTFSYASAQALRWWFHAIAESNFDGICLESRLVRHRIKHSYSSQAESVHGRIGGDDRSNSMPDWGRSVAEQQPDSDHQD